MFDLALTEFAQIVPPMTVLREILGDALRNENVPGIAAVHHPLRNINSGAGDVGAVVHIGHATDRPAVNSHPELNVRMTFQRITNLECTFHRRFRVGKKRKHHSVARWQTDQFLGCVCASELFRVAHHLVQLVE